MPFSDLLVVADPGSDAAGRFAISVARRFEAHLTAATLIVDPTTSLGFLETAAASLDTFLEEARIAAQRNLDDLARSARASAVAIETEIAQCGVLAIVEIFGRHLRPYDLIVAEQACPDRPDERDLIIEAALFGAGCPVLVVPYVHDAPFRSETIVIAWDDSAPATRAVGHALPILEAAQRVEIVMVKDALEGDWPPGVKLKRHLRRHGIDAELCTIPGTGDVADALLSHASNSEADLLVMGGYGHSRFREIILGGATRGILEAMTLPVLMSH